MTTKIRSCSFHMEDAARAGAEASTAASSQADGRSVQSSSNKPAIVFNLVQGVVLQLEYSGDITQPEYDPEAKLTLLKQPDGGQYKMVGPAMAMKKLTGLAPIGMFSPLCVINLPQQARAEAGVPDAAKYFSFLYPAEEGQEQLTHLNLKEEPWACVFLIGGFAYFDEKRQPVAINAYMSAMEPKPQQRSRNNLSSSIAAMHIFLGPNPVTVEAVHALEENGRLSTVTSPELQNQGLRRFAWVHPNENVGGHPLHAATEPPNSYGALVYVKEDGNGISYRLGTADNQSVADFFQSKDASPFNHLRKRIEEDINRVSGKEAARRAMQAGEEIRKATSRRRRSLSTTAETADIVFLAVRNKHQQKKPWYVIHPEARCLGLWDAFSMSALVFTATVTPFEVAFLASSKSPAEPLFIVNRIVDIIFFLDMVLQFFLMYRISLRGPSSKDGVWEDRPSKIAKNYMQSWFVVDVFSMLPSTFDIVPLVIDQIEENAERSQSLRVLRTARALRLVKLVRLVRSSRVIKRVLSKVPISYGALTLLTLVLATLGAAHIIACVMGMIATLYADNRLDSWFATHGLCWPSFTNGDGEIRPYQCAGVGQLYLQCFYFAIGAIVMYTDSPKIGPHEEHYSRDPEVFGHNEGSIAQWTNIEQVLVQMILFGGACAWAYVTAKFVDVIANGEPAVQDFRLNMDVINRFCSNHGIPPHKRRMMRQYMQECFESRDALDCKIVFELLPDHLVYDPHDGILWDVHGPWLSGMPFMKLPRWRQHDPVQYLEMPFMMRLSVLMTPQVFFPDEIVPGKRLYAILHGTAMHNRKLLEKFDNWGIDDAVLQGEYVHRLQAFAVSYLHCLWIDRSGLEQLKDDFPQEIKRIRFYCVWRAVFFYMVKQHSKGELKQCARQSRWAQGPPPLRRANTQSLVQTTGGCSHLADEVSALRDVVNRLETRSMATEAAAEAAAAAATSMTRSLDALRAEVNALAVQNAAAAASAGSANTSQPRSSQTPSATLASGSGARSRAPRSSGARPSAIVPVARV